MSELPLWAIPDTLVRDRLTNIIGHVTAYHDGVSSKHVDPKGNEVPGPVLVLGGHSLVAADPERFEILSEHIAAFMHAFSATLGRVVTRMVEAAAKDGIGPEQSVMIIESVLREQVAALKTSRHDAPR